MAKISKEKIDLDTTLVELKFILKGYRQEVKIYTTATQATEFVDVLNENRHRNMNRAEREAMDNKYYTFDDYKRKSTVTVNLNEVKVMEIPFFIDEGKEYDFKFLSFRV